MVDDPRQYRGAAVEEQGGAAPSDTCRFNISPLWSQSVGLESPLWYSECWCRLAPVLIPSVEGDVSCHTLAESV